MTGFTYESLKLIRQYAKANANKDNASEYIYDSIIVGIITQALIVLDNQGINMSGFEWGSDTQSLDILRHVVKFIKEEHSA
jgi:hypothetical protein